MSKLILMQQSSLPPPHPSLPRNPNNPVNSQPEAPLQHSTPYTAHHHLPAYYNSHYAQAYLQTPSSSQTNYATMLGRTPHNSGHNRGTPHYAMNSWYEPGNNRCSHYGCSFSGSHKSVELHMMDRHLIYPPGWEKRKKQNEWDADPSLKGKPIPIQGTNVVLDSPEVLEAWIAERKRRFPTSSRVEEKKRKISEAVARGQLDLTTSSRAPKRRKMEPRDNSSGEHTRNLRSLGQDRGRKVPPTGWESRAKGKQTALTVNPDACPPSPNLSDDDDGEPETMSSKVLPTIPHTDFEAFGKSEALMAPSTSAALTDAKLGSKARAQPLQPKLPPRNPFASRPTLLRNLLLPEMRITISNLSQAIHFLVDNDFLQNVETKPGQALDANRIEIVKDDA